MACKGKTMGKLRITSSLHPFSKNIRLAIKKGQAQIFFSTSTCLKRYLVDDLCSSKFIKCCKTEIAGYF
jgi:hypothetical protein